MTIQLTSQDFAAGQPIPQQFTGEGQDQSPHLQWSGVPEGTRELVLICDDPDAPTDEPWVHWVLYGLDPGVTELPRDFPTDATVAAPLAGKQGQNSWTDGQTIGYRGPMPPPGHGVHHYHFRLYAVDRELELPPGAEKSDVLAAMDGHVLAQGELVGTYER